MCHTSGPGKLHFGPGKVGNLFSKMSKKQKNVSVCQGCKWSYDKLTIFHQ